MNQPFSYCYNIRAYERGADGGVPLYQIGNYLQDIAGRHAAGLGWSIDALQQDGRSWILSRLKLEIDTPVTGNDKQLTIRTWPCGADRIYAYRAFDLQNEMGTLIGKALSYWILLDIESKRPVPMPGEIAELANHYPEPPLKPSRPRLQKPESTAHQVNFQVLPSDLDLNGHVNNSVYIRWLEDVLRKNTRSTDHVRNLDILYKTEVVENDQITVVSDHFESEPVRMAVLREGEEACIAELQ